MISHRLRRFSLLALPALFYIGLARHYRLAREEAPTGDEPHYLVVAESLVHYRDVDVRRAYEEQGARIYGGPLAAHASLGPHGLRSGHGLGLPVLIAVPWALWGRAGVRVFLCLLAGVFPFLIEPIVAARVGSGAWSIGITLLLALAMPFWSATDQIFPDLPTGLLVLLGASATLDGSPRKRWLALAGTAFLPWLHLKNLAPAALLAVGLTVTAFRSRARESLPATQDVPPTPGSSATPEPIFTGLYAALTPIAFLASVLALLAYQQSAFGRALPGPYAGDALRFDPREWGMTFGGLLLDQAQGLFLQSPLWLLGVAGLIPMARRAPYILVFVALLWLSLILPNAMHPNWYGGHSLAGRFWWSSFALWAFPLAIAVEELGPRSRWLWIFIAMQAAVSAHHLMLVLVHRSLLYRPEPLTFSPAHSLFPALADWLPRFDDLSRYAAEPANWIAVVLLLAVALAGLRLRGARWPTATDESAPPVNP